jgi:hypothetical protein
MRRCQPSTNSSTQRPEPVALAGLTKERDGIVKKKKLVDAALESVDKEIASFQKEKQFSMNDIEMVLSLRMSQVLNGLFLAKRRNGIFLLLSRKGMYLTQFLAG